MDAPLAARTCGWQREDPISSASLVFDAIDWDGNIVYTSVLWLAPRSALSPMSPSRDRAADQAR